MNEYKTMNGTHVFDELNFFLVIIIFSLSRKLIPRKTAEDQALQYCPTSFLVPVLLSPLWGPGKLEMH